MDKPKSDQPTFFARSQAMRGQQRIGDVLDLYTSNPNITTGQLFDATIDVLSEVLVGWTNMGDMELNRDVLREVLTYQEARELLRKVMYNQHLVPEEKKS